MNIAIPIALTFSFAIKYRKRIMHKILFVMSLIVTTLAKRSIVNEHLNLATKVFIVNKLHPHAITPKKGSPYSAGFDLHSVEDIVIPARKSRLVPIGLSMVLPEGTYGRIASRSGLATKHNIEVGAGVIDRDYRGLVQVQLINHGDEDYKVEMKHKIAQLIITKYEEEVVLKVNEFGEERIYGGTYNSQRGNNGFGSTGY